MALIRGSMPYLLDQAMRVVLFEKYDNYPEEYSKVFNILSTKHATEKDASISGFGTMPVKNEGVGITYDNPLQGYEILYTMLTYGLGFRVTEEMMEDDLTGKIKKMPAALAKAAHQTVEQTAANIFNNGFVTTYNAGGDTKALFANDHPLKGGGMASNIPAASVDLTLSSLQAAITAMEETVDDRGNLLAIKPKKLIIPAELKFTARELLKSSGKPGTADNNINSIQEDGLTAQTWHYLTDPDAWFLLADDHELNFFWRKKLVSDSDTDFDSGDLKFKAVMRFDVGFSDWRGVYGSAGA